MKYYYCFWHSKKRRLEDILLLGYLTCLSLIKTISDFKISQVHLYLEFTVLIGSWAHIVPKCQTTGCQRLCVSWIKQHPADLEPWVPGTDLINSATLQSPSLPYKMETLVCLTKLLWVVLQRIIWTYGLCWILTGFSIKLIFIEGLLCALNRCFGASFF